jgi:8-amino-7-oxononanoate synthase
MFKEQLEKIRSGGTYRQLPDIEHSGKFICREGRYMLNVSSNDYLGLAGRVDLRDEFLKRDDLPENLFSASSARLLTGNHAACRQLESYLESYYEREAALLFNSGYHANMGILPALTTSSSLILADKLVHASLIDGIMLCRCHSVRYRHNDYEQLERLLEENNLKYDRIFVVTESLFSMDGDIADLRYICSLKRKYKNVLVYVDEAHAVGARGEKGRGISEEQDVIRDIDILVGTFGKALASAGAFAVTSSDIRKMMINSVRSFIFTTALPPVNILWSLFILEKIPYMRQERENLVKLQSFLSQHFPEQTVSSYIFPFRIGDSKESISVAERLQQEGYYALPIRPPTVPEGTSRIRFSLTASVTEDDLSRLIALLKEIKKAETGKE